MAVYPVADKFAADFNEAVWIVASDIGAVKSTTRSVDGGDKNRYLTRRIRLALDHKRSCQQTLNTELSANRPNQPHLARLRLDLQQATAKLRQDIRVQGVKQTITNMT